MTAYTYERSLRTPIFSKEQSAASSYRGALRAISTLAVLCTLAVGAAALKLAIWLPAFVNLH